MSDSSVPAQGGITVTNQSAPKVDTNNRIQVDLSAKAQAPVEPQVVAEATPVVEEKAPDKFAAKFAALSRQEKQVREAMVKMKADQAALESARAEVERMKTESSTSNNDFMARLKQNPFEILEQAGLSLEDLAQMTLNEGKITPEKLIKQTRDELDAKYQKELEALKTSIKEKEENEERGKYQQVERQFKSDIADLIKSNPDTYELIAANNAQETVFEVIEEHYKSTGRILSIQEAAEATEGYLEEEAKKLLALKKFQISKKEEPKVEIKKTAPTLSNTLSSEVPTHGEKLLSREESIARAAKLISWDT